MLYIEREEARERERERERERHTCDREALINCFLVVPRLVIEPETWVCAVTGKETCNLLVHGITLQPSEPPRQGNIFYLF